jgi:hypothetical protein
MPLEESTPAIVLRARDYSESDRIVTLLTENFGKLAGIAKGANASRKRFERKLEPFSQVILYFRRRPHGQLVFITRADPGDAPADRLEDDLRKTGGPGKPVPAGLIDGLAVMDAKLGVLKSDWEADKDVHQFGITVNEIKVEKATLVKTYFDGPTYGVVPWREVFAQ